MSEPPPAVDDNVPESDSGSPADANEVPTTAVLKPLSSRARKIVNIVIAVLVPGAIAYFAWDNWDTFVAGPWDVRPQLFALAGVLYMVSEGLPPLGWNSLMRSAGSPPPNLRSLYFVWFAVEPLKYLPIPVGPFVGRYALAYRVGLNPVPAIVTLAYEFVITLGVTVGIALPGFIWLAVIVEPGYRWAVLVVLGFMLLFAFATLREGGLSRTIGDMFGNRAAFEGQVSLERRALITPAVIALVAFLVRITAAGLVIVALTPANPFLAPLYGLVFTAGAMMPFGRFGTREVAITVGLRALDFDAGPALLAALVSRAYGLLTSLIWLGISAAVGGGRKVSGSDAAPDSSAPGDAVRASAQSGLPSDA